MPHKDPEERKAYQKEYREKNKEKIKEYRKEYKLNNKEQIKEYNQTDAGKKNRRIRRWKQIGVKSEDFNSLYEYYLNCNNCENCDIELIEGNYGANRRCLDHSHKTGLFRNVLCNTCNVRRK
jgi:hypothetical protein